LWRGSVYLPELAASLPACIYFWPTTRSYTRQPLAEIHTLCTRPLLEGILHAACMAGARLANRGEFTLRAFLAGRIDLPQAEAVLGVIDADNDRGLRVALRQLSGGISVPLVALRDQLLDLLAHLEAGLDFVEEDIHFVTADELLENLNKALVATTQLSNQLETRKTSSSYPRVVIWGPPNAGKSSLFNVLSGFTAAVVHHQAGTTRDYVSCVCQVQESLVELIDTAGVSPALDSAIDQSAQQQTWAVAEHADLYLWCCDLSTGHGEPIPIGHGERASLSKTIVVGTKSDLAGTIAAFAADAFCCSSLTQEGIHGLREEIHRRLALMSKSDVVASTAARCRASLREVMASLSLAISFVHDGAGEEIIAAELRGALNGLGQIVGTVYSEDVLDRIFSRFCIGK
jgi:tRNA modification GTPase